MDRQQGHPDRPDSAMTSSIVSGVDVRRVPPNKPSERGLEQDLGLVGDHYRYIDEFGIGWQMPQVGGHYYDLYRYPFADVDTVEEVEAYPWPDMLDRARFVGMKEHAAHSGTRRGTGCRPGPGQLGYVGARHVDDGLREVLHGHGRQPQALPSQDGEDPRAQDAVLGAGPGARRRGLRHRLLR